MTYMAGAKIHVPSFLSISLSRQASTFWEPWFLTVIPNAIRDIWTLIFVGVTRNASCHPELDSASSENPVILDLIRHPAGCAVIPNVIRDPEFPASFSERCGTVASVHLCSSAQNALGNEIGREDCQTHQQVHSQNTVSQKPLTSLETIRCTGSMVFPTCP